MSAGPLAALIRAQRKRHADGLRLAAISAAVVGAASVLLLGLSGWFLTGAAIAGLGGLAAAQAFNVLLPSAGIRLLAILRTAFRYLERLSGHAAALKALAAIRPTLYASLAAAPPAQALALSRGEASARLVQDVDAVETRLIRLSAPWGAGAAVAAGLAMAAPAGWAPALVVALAVAATVLGVRILFRRLTARTGPAIQQAAGDLKDALAAYAAAAPELRVYGVQDRAAAEIAAKGARLDALRRRGRRRRRLGRRAAGRDPRPGRRPGPGARPRRRHAPGRHGRFGDGHGAGGTDGRRQGLRAGGRGGRGGRAAGRGVGAWAEGDGERPGFARIARASGSATSPWSRARGWS
jgi:ABC-type transport system involved in cytochrome bd biosynthesis fused ATPase/permease subunit